MCSSSAPGVCSSVSSSSSTCACAPSCAELDSVPSGCDSSGSAVPAMARRDSAAGAASGAAEAAVTLRRRRGAGALTASAAAWSCSCDSVDSDVVRRAMGLALSEADAVVVPSTHQRGCAPEREQRKSLRVRPAGRMPCLTSTQTGLAAARLRRRKVLGQGRSEGATPGTGTEHPKPDRSIPHIRR